MVIHSEKINILIEIEIQTILFRISRDHKGPRCLIGCKLSNISLTSAWTRK